MGHLPWMYVRQPLFGPIIGSMSWLNNLLMVVAETVLSSMDDSAKAARVAFLSMMELRSYLDPERHYIKAEYLIGQHLIH